MKYKIVVILVTLTVVCLGTGVTYSMFHSKSNLMINQKIAAFVFDTKKLDHLELELDSLVPNTSKEYNFQVTNTKESKSNVTLNYQLIIKTFHFMPLDIKLYKDNELVMVCDENFGRNENNELVCKSKVFEMANNVEVLDNFKLEVTFPKEYNSIEYANIVDFLDIEIKSWQKVGDV